MLDQVDTFFTPERIGQQAKGNLNAICCVTMSYLKEKGLSLDDYWTYVGQRFSSGWEKLGTNDAAKWTAFNMVSTGCTLLSLSGDETQAETVLSGWPSGASLNEFNLTQEEADTIWELFRSIAESLGYAYSWHRKGDAVTVTFSEKN